MNSLVIAAQQLNINEMQLYHLMQHWYGAGFLDPEKLEYALSTYMTMPPESIKTIIEVISQSIFYPVRRHPSYFNASKACDAIFSEPNQIGYALAFINLMQQNHFTKGSRKEVDVAVKTAYTQNCYAEIELLASEFDLLDAQPLNEPVDVALLIGGRVDTNVLYLEDLKEGLEKHLINYSYILLSDRLLIMTPGNADNPSYSPLSKLPFGEHKHFIDYLKEKYPGQTLTEGLAMRETFEHLFGYSLDSAQAKQQGIHVITGTKNSYDFDRQALHDALQQGYLKEGSKVSALRLQPYLKNFAAQLRNIIAHDESLLALNLELSVHGRSARCSAPEIIQTLAMMINSQYDLAAKAILMEYPDAVIIPKERVQFLTRDSSAYDAQANVSPSRKI